MRSGRLATCLRAGAWFLLATLGACLVLLVAIPLARADDGAAASGPAYWPIWATAGINLVFTFIGSMVLETHRRAANDAREALQRLSNKLDGVDMRLSETREQHAQRLADARQEAVPRSEMRVELTELRDGQREQDKKLAELGTKVNQLLQLMSPGGHRG